MPNNNSKLKNSSYNKVVSNNISSGGVPWDVECDEQGPKREETYTYLPSTNITDNQVVKFHDFLENLVKRKVFCSEFDINGSDTIETLYKKLNYRIAQCKKYKEDALNLTKELMNNYVIISRYERKYKDEDELVECEEIGPTPYLHYEVNKSITFPEQVCIGYIYRIVLDIRRESFFHVYFRPMIYTDTLGRSANLREDEIRDVSFEELSTVYKIITKDEYERKIKELFIKDIPTD